MVKAVSFDLWFTLIWEKHPEDEEMYSRMRIESIISVLKSGGYDVSAEQVRELYSSLGASRMLMSCEEVASLILAALGVDSNSKLVSEVAEAYELSTETFKPRENPEARAALSMLKEIGMKIGVVSNTSFSARGVRALLKNVGISDYVDVVISSSDVGFVKPQRMIFRELVRSMRVAPSEVVHVGDACVEDVLGALSNGIRAIYYVGLLHLRSAKPSRICSELVPTAKSLSELPEILRSMG